MKGSVHKVQQTKQFKRINNTLRSKSTHSYIKFLHNPELRLAVRITSWKHQNLTIKLL